MDFDRFGACSDDDIAGARIVLRRFGAGQEFPFGVGPMRRSGRFGISPLDRDWL